MFNKNKVYDKWQNMSEKERDRYRERQRERLSKGERRRVGGNKNNRKI